MTVCSFFLQGRCRYGEKCWNEHPRGGRGGDYRENQQPSRGGFGNRVWINPSQRTGGDYVQPSSNNDWSHGGGGGAAPQNIKSSDFSFSSQNRFSALASNSHSDKAAQNSAEDVDTIQTDMEIWQTSGQWLFSCYSALKGRISGFVEVSPEELRLEYYSGRAAGDLQPYMNSVQQLVKQWSSRVQELRIMSASTRISLISELNDPSSPTSTHGFGSTASGFGATSSSSSSSSSGFGAGGFGSGSQSRSTFSFASNTQQASGFSSAAFAQPSSGFGAPSAASFSFAENKASSATAFSFKPSSGGLGSGFGSSAPADSGGLGQSGASANASHPADSLFTAHSDLTAEELKEFTAKRFTLGQIPLKPPPADLLVV